MWLQLASKGLLRRCRGTGPELEAKADRIPTLHRQPDGRMAGDDEVGERNGRR